MSDRAYHDGVAAELDDVASVARHHIDEHGEVPVGVVLQLRGSGSDVQGRARSGFGSAAVRAYQEGNQMQQV